MKEKTGIEDIGLTEEELKDIQKRIEKEKINQFLKEADSNPLLRKNNIKVVNGSHYLFFKTLSIIFILILVSVAVFFGYLGYKGYFKSEIIQDVRISPLFNSTINNEISNNYSFNQKTEIENKYNHTIIINNLVECP